MCGSRAQPHHAWPKELKQGRASARLRTSLSLFSAKVSTTTATMSCNTWDPWSENPEQVRIETAAVWSWAGHECTCVSSCLDLPNQRTTLGRWGTTPSGHIINRAIIIIIIVIIIITSFTITEFPRRVLWLNSWLVKKLGHKIFIQRMIWSRGFSYEG